MVSASSSDPHDPVSRRAASPRLSGGLVGRPGLHRRLARVATASASGLVAIAAAAHGIVLDVEVEGATLRGAARYSDRSPVAQEPVEIFSPPASQEPLGSTTTAADGRFSFQGTPGRSYRVTVDAGEGHVVERVVTAPDVVAPAAAAAGGLTRADLDAALLPLREDLARLASQWRLMDLLAGLGCVFGIYGLVATFRARKS